MKILESAPSRYDKGIRILTLGRVDKAYDRLTSCIKEGQRVLDIGCGTGALALRAAARGARVVAIDVNSHMLEIAARRLQQANPSGSVELREQGVAELSSEPSDHYDVIMSGLCFSELTEDEREYALGEIRRILKPGGLLLIADEVRPRGILRKILHEMIRIPLAIVAYILTQTTTTAIKNLPEKVSQAGFIIESCRRSRLGNFMELVAKKAALNPLGVNQ